MSDAELTTSGPRWPRWVPVILAALGFLPLLFWHIGGLLERPHYQFLYLLPITLWILQLAADPVPIAEVSKSETWLGAVLMIPCVAALAYAAWVWSPWIAACSAMLAAVGVILIAAGWRGIRNWFPTWVFCWVLIPLPFGMDEDLIVYLRGITTRLSSAVLDQIGVWHNSYANVIELPGKPLFIADACSGIHSLYVLMAAALFLCVWLKRGILHTITLLISTSALVLIENVTRIVAVAVLWNQGFDYSMGFKHDMLGFVLFIVSLGFMSSIDQLLLFVLPTRLPSPLDWAYTRLTSPPSRPGKGRDAPPESSGSFAHMTALGLVALFPVLGLAQLFALPASAPEFSVSTYDDFEIPELGPEALPETIGEFRRQSFSTVKRVHGDPLGQASQQWFYDNGPVSLVMSIDYPYGGVHDLCECYSAIGWEIADRRVITRDQLSEMGINADGPLAVGKVSRDLYGHGIVMFNLVDTAGTTSAIIKDLARGDANERSLRRLESFGNRGEVQHSENMAPPFIQFQLFGRTTAAVTEEAERSLIQIFHEARNNLLKQIEIQGRS